MPLQAASSFVARDIYQQWEDPIQSAQQIGNVETEFFVLAGDGDKIRPPEYQRRYADALADKGLRTHFWVVKMPSNPHNMTSESLRVAEACGLGEEPSQPSTLVGYGRFGARLRKATDEAAERLGIKSARGVLVVDIDNKSPAKRAGIESGDVIVKFDNTEMTELSELVRAVADTPAGRAVTVTIVRKGQGRNQDGHARPIVLHGKNWPEPPMGVSERSQTNRPI